MDLKQGVKADLAAWGQGLTDAYRAALSRGGKNASYVLSNSVTPRTGESGDEVVLGLDIAAHWKYIEWDTKPHMPPVSAILEWVLVKPVIPREDARGRIPTEEQLAYLIARKIARVGTTGGRYLTTAIDAKLPDIEQKLSVTLAQWTQAQTLAEFAALSKK